MSTRLHRLYIGNPHPSLHRMSLAIQVLTVRMESLALMVQMESPVLMVRMESLVLMVQMEFPVLMVRMEFPVLMVRMESPVLMVRMESTVLMVQMVTQVQEVSTLSNIHFRSNCCLFSFLHACTLGGNHVNQAQQVRLFKITNTQFEYSLSFLISSLLRTKW